MFIKSKIQNPKSKAQSPKLKIKMENKYDLKERLAVFAESVIDLVRKCRITSINKRIIGQVVTAAGAIGANYMEGDAAESKKDFIHKVRISLKEAKETQHWLRLLARIENRHKDELRKLWIEASEISRILGKILINSR